MLPTPAGTEMRVLQRKGHTACVAAKLCFQIGKTMGEVTDAVARAADATAATEYKEKAMSVAGRP